MDKGLSQKAFAAQIGVHVTNLSKYERSKFIPSLDIAEKMAIILDISLDELVYVSKMKKPVSKFRITNFFLFLIKHSCLMRNRRKLL